MLQKSKVEIKHAPPPRSLLAINCFHLWTDLSLLPAFAECARNRTFTTTWVCRDQRLAMNSCMLAHASPEEEDRAREEWFAGREARRRQREEQEASVERRREQVIRMMREDDERKRLQMEASGSRR